MKPSEVRLFLELEGADEDPLGLEIGCSVCDVQAGMWCGVIPSAYEIVLSVPAGRGPAPSLLTPLVPPATLIGCNP